MTEQYPALVVGAPTNIRQSPNLSSKIVGVIPTVGQVVQLGSLDQSGLWYKINVGTVDGWVHSQYIQFAPIAHSRLYHNVININQLTGNQYSNMCGQTSVAMVANVLTTRLVTHNQVANETKFTSGGFTSFNNLIAMLNYYGISSQHHRPINVAWLLSQVTQRPLIVLVDYPSLERGYASWYKFAHFVVLVGYEYTTDGQILFTLADPLNKNGSLTTVTLAQMSNSILRPSRTNTGTNYPAQALRITNPGVLTIPGYKPVVEPLSGQPDDNPGEDDEQVPDTSIRGLIEDVLSQLEHIMTLYP